MQRIFTRTGNSDGTWPARVTGGETVHEPPETTCTIAYLPKPIMVSYRPGSLGKPRQVSKNQGGFRTRFPRVIPSVQHGFTFEQLPRIDLGDLMRILIISDMEKNSVTANNTDT